MPYEDLAKEIEYGRAVLVLGSGVSAFTTAGAQASTWIGLLRHGVSFAQQRTGTDNGWLDWVEGDFKQASSTPGALLSAAEKIVDKLGGVTSPLFTEWMAASVGDLPLVNEHLIRVIDRLGSPVTTTNYDLLFERVTGRQFCNWRQPQLAIASLRSRSTDVLHWHGDWRSPESVVLNAQSYGAILANHGAQQLQSAAATLNTMVFIGVGTGLEDPNFGALIEWTRQYAPGVRHFRLCLDREVQSLREQSPNVEPVPYGSCYEELVPFLEELAGRSAVETRQWSAVTVYSLEAIDQRLRSELIIAEHVPEADSKAVSEMVLTPILLPIPPNQFAAQQAGATQQADSESTPKAKRCDASEEAVRSGVMVLVSDELGGLTTTLQWMLQHRVSRNRPGMPLYLDFLTLSAGARPLEREIRKQLRPWIVGGGRPDAPLPSLSIAVDNVSSRPPKIFSKMLEDIKHLSVEAVYLGCKTGAEIEVIDKLATAGVGAEVRYLGPLAAKDVRRLARIARASAADEITHQTLNIVAREHLARTPFTISLLISALLTNDVFAAPASETALLDSYVSLLLGRGDPHDDARFAFDAVEREAMLARLAGYMVEQKAGAIDESAAIGVLQDYFESVDWSEDPIDVLTNLRARRVIAIRNGRIRFVQSSFLHLFAAKYALQEESFRGDMFSRPLFYGPILRHYAALRRGDAEAVRVVGELLAPESPNMEPAGAFADWGEVGPSVVDIDSFLAHIEEAGSSGDESSLDIDGPDGEDEFDGAELFDIDLYEPTDIEPFPLLRFEDMPPLQKAMTTVQLVSNVLRDSELVRDLNLKTTVLINVLGMWADVCRLLDKDETYRHVMRRIGDSLADTLEVSDATRETIIAELLSTSSAIAAFSGMSDHLSSRKLFRTVKRALEDPRMKDFQAGQILGALLAFDVMAPGFGQLVYEVTSRYPNTPAVSIVLHRFAFLAYLYLPLESDDEAALCKAIALITMQGNPNATLAGTISNFRTLRNKSLAAVRKGEKKSPNASRQALAAADIPKEPEED
jgi:hypothetical protein